MAITFRYCCVQIVLNTSYPNGSCFSYIQTNENEKIKLVKKVLEILEVLERH